VKKRIQTISLENLAKLTQHDRASSSGCHRYLRTDLIIVDKQSGWPVNGWVQFRW